MKFLLLLLSFSVIVYSFECGAGQYFDNSCRACGKGYYCEGNDTRAPCPAGKYNSLLVADNVNLCIQCDIGEYSLQGAPACITCSEGTYNTLTGSSACDNCQQGTWRVAANAVCSVADCNAGYYCSGDGVKRACPAGRYNSNEGAITIGSCLGCISGMYSSEIAANSNSTCKICRPGSYCPGSSDFLPCPSGTYSESLGNSDLSFCIACGAGLYGVMSGATNSSSCAACPGGKYSNVTVGSSISVCNSCTSGKFSQSGQSVCSVCPEGSYSLYSSSRCILCEPGSYSISFGNSFCNLCGPGKFGLTPGLSSNLCSGSCQSGYFCDSGSVISTQSICPSGFYCPLGILEPLPCPVGSYCPPQSSENLPCPIGTFGASNKLFNSTCSGLCPSGYICPLGSTNSSMKLCLAGTVSSPGSFQCSECPRGTYQNIAGASSCNLCPPSKTSGNAATECTDVIDTAGIIGGTSILFHSFYLTIFLVGSFLIIIILIALLKRYFRIKKADTALAWVNYPVAHELIVRLNLDFANPELDGTSKDFARVVQEISNSLVDHGVSVSTPGSSSWDGFIANFILGFETNVTLIPSGNKILRYCNLGTFTVSPLDVRNRLNTIVMAIAENSFANNSITNRSDQKRFGDPDDDDTGHDIQSIQLHDNSSCDKTSITLPTDDENDIFSDIRSD